MKQVATPRELAPALLIIRLSAAAFLGVWASLKFYRPEWMVNVFTNTYKLGFVTENLSYAVGTVQLLVVFAFAIGFLRNVSYTLIALMSGAGVIGTLLNGSLLDFTQFPRNLLWAAVPTFGALIALWLLRKHDRLLSVDAWRQNKG